jgi:hypothetical protein
LAAAGVILLPFLACGPNAALFLSFERLGLFHNLLLDFACYRAVLARAAYIKSVAVLASKFLPELAVLPSPRATASPIRSRSKAGRKVDTLANVYAQSPVSMFRSAPQPRQ